MAKYKSEKNILAARDTYNRYYGDFRGVDFSSDHTQVAEGRLAYLVNMYRDYGAGQGKALEVMPGFRRRAHAPNGKKIHAIHTFERRDEETGENKTDVLLHAGKSLYLWRSFPDDADIEESESTTVPPSTGENGNVPVYQITLSTRAQELTAVTTASGRNITDFAVLSSESTVSITSSIVTEGKTIYISYIRNVTPKTPLFAEMNERKSTSFVMNGKLYLLDGKNYLVYDGVTCAETVETAYVPTTYINTVPSGVNADIGTEYEQRNLLSDKYRQTFIADGETKEFYVNEAPIDRIVSVTVYGVQKTEGSDFALDAAGEKIIFNEAPTKPEETVRDPEVQAYYPEGYAGVEIVVARAAGGIAGASKKGAELICGCTLAAIFDGRVFLSGNADVPNTVFYCERNAEGYADPSYFGALNYMHDGVTNAPITALLPVADTLTALKEKSAHDGTVFYHTPYSTENNVQPKIYPSSQGLTGTGCTGEAINFFDDPIFLSRMGVEGIGQLSVRYERAVEHRSTLIDAKLANEDPAHARLCEWDGYLAMLAGGGRMYLADSRQRYTHETGAMQYEWYYAEDVGTFEGQYTEYTYARTIPDILIGASIRHCTTCGNPEGACTCDDSDDVAEIPLCQAAEELRGQVANAPDESGNAEKEVYFALIRAGGYEIGVNYTLESVTDEKTREERTCAVLCETRGAQTGGVFKPATALANIGGNLYFGTENGWICCFNTDKRGDDGTISPAWYTADERAIFAGCATKMDNCGIPHLTKSTVKKSTVVKTKTFADSAAKIRVRTNRKPYEQIARINSRYFSFDNVDFADFSFETTEQSLFAIREKEKKWIEKQYFIYTDEYAKPFALYYVCYRYVIAGRFKE